MDTSPHHMATLFQQLGLKHDNQSIHAFIASHALKDTEMIYNASFWSEAQAQFLQESLNEDSDWAEQVDQLSAILRH